MNSLRESKRLKALTTSKRQTIIRLIEKPNKYKRFISNLRTILLVDIDQNLISKNVGRKIEKKLFHF